MRWVCKPNMESLSVTRSKGIASNKDKQTDKLVVSITSLQTTDKELNFQGLKWKSERVYAYTRKNIIVWWKQNFELQADI